MRFQEQWKGRSRTGLVTEQETTLLARRPAKGLEVRWASILLAFLAGCSSGSNGPGIPVNGTPAARTLQLISSGGLTSSGQEGGPFTPAGTEYVLRNDGVDPLVWTASSDESWARLSTMSGQIPPGATESVTVSIDPTVASSLLQGAHTATLSFEDLTNGQRFNEATRLEVRPVISSDLLVTPPGGLQTTSIEGGAITGPQSLTLTLTNTGFSPLSWAASEDQSWIQLSEQWGALAPFQQTTLTVSIDQGIVSALGLGTYSGVVSVVDLTKGGVFQRSASIQVLPAGGSGSLASSITQFGITWTFDRAYEAGQFANGDWWVVGPVEIVAIEPPSTEVDGRTTNGSMVNPSPRNGTTQGYDSSMYAQYKQPGDFDPKLNVAWDVSSANPLQLQPHSSLVSTISKETPEVRPQIHTAAILTVLPSAAAPGDFRPSYCGSDKTIRFNEVQLDDSLLAEIAPAPGMSDPTSFHDAERMFERPWLDHVPLWIGRYIHPAANMPDYGREIVDNVSVAALLLHMDYPVQQKRKLLVRFVQLGIDFYGIAMDGGQSNWRSAAGHMSGRKWPILFAGLMLGDPEMSGVGTEKSIRFGEDDQTFYVQETPVGSGIYNDGYGGYGAQHVGMPEWGTNHPMQPWFDDVNWLGDPYRLCCTANAWWGQLLAAHIMGREHWGHQALFDYQDRFLDENAQRNILDWRMAWRDWYYEMWLEYRNDY